MTLLPASLEVRDSDIAQVASPKWYLQLPRTNAKAGEEADAKCTGKYCVKLLISLHIFLPLTPSSKPTYDGMIVWRKVWLNTLLKYGTDVLDMPPVP